MSISFSVFLLFGGCVQTSIKSEDPVISGEATRINSNDNSQDINLESEIELLENTESVKSESTENQTIKPKTIRDFFMLLPEKYFTLESCDHKKDKDCKQARIDYLKNFAEIEDTKNGYLKGGCDGAQSCLEMTIFKRPDKTYVVALSTFAEMMEDTYFLDYKNGIWTDISTKIIPEFDKKKIYELPRQGTTIKVYTKNIIEKGDDYEIGEKGNKLYDLEWKDGKFVINK